MLSEAWLTLEGYFQRMFLMAGEMVLLFGRALGETRHAPRKFPAVLRQMLHIGYHTLPLTAMVGLFTGMIVALQTGIELRKFGLQQIVGGVVGLSVTREMGPVITAFIIAARVGAAMAAELGTMKVGEEIDALRALGIRPERYLVMPRILAALTMQPILTAYSVLVAVWGGAFVSAGLLGVSSDIYWRRLESATEAGDVLTGTLKSAVFAAIISTVCCQQGMATQGGAQGVGRATTRSVVISLTMILIADYLLNWILSIE